MVLIIRIQLNNKEIRCYGVQRVTNTQIVNPYGTMNTYEVRECYTKNLIGNVDHYYDESPEKLVMKVMKLIAG